MAAGEDRTFTEAQNQALVDGAVKDATAEVSKQVESLEQEKADLQTKLDGLEAEKATLTKERDDAVKAHDDFKAETEKKETIATAKVARSKAVKDANDKLADDYFTDERVNRWAEMSEEAFADVIEAIKVTPATPPEPKRETAAFTGGATPPAPSDVPKSRAFTAPYRGQSN